MFDGLINPPQDRPCILRVEPRTWARRQVVARRLVDIPNPWGLSAAQMTVLPLIRDGLSNEQIAARLGLSIKTVEGHIAVAFPRMKVAQARGVARVQAAVKFDRWEREQGRAGC